MTFLLLELLVILDIADNLLLLSKPDGLGVVCNGGVLWLGDMGGAVGLFVESLEALQGEGGVATGASEAALVPELVQDAQLLNWVHRLVTPGTRRVHSYAVLCRS